MTEFRRLASFHQLAHLLAVGTTFVWFAGCDTRDEPLKPLEIVETETPDAINHFPLTIIDRLEREVTFAVPPRRIISLTPSMTEMIYFLGAEDRLVGVTAFCNYPPEAQQKAKIGGGTNESISRELLLELEPDLVLCKWDNHEPVIAQLDGWEIPAIGLGAESLDGMYEELVLLGRITRREEQARQLVEELKQRVAAILQRVRVNQDGSRPLVFYQVWDDPLMSAGPDSFIGTVLTMAGVENLVEGTAIRYPKISSETVIAGNPEIIIAPTSHSEPVTIESILSRDGWGELDAIRNQRVYLIDGDQISRCAPRLVDALDEIVSAVHDPPSHEDHTP